MAYTLYTGEMLQALKNANHPLTEALAEQYVALNTTIATALAAHCGIDFSADEYPEDGRLASSFGPRFEGQPLPECMADFDTESEWND